jgi:superfamily II DNA or RNA helicase
LGSRLKGRISVPRIPAPPAEPEELLGWATTHGVAHLLDTLFMDDVIDERGGRKRRRFSYRELLTSPRRDPFAFFSERRMALEVLEELTVQMQVERATRAWLDKNGREPQDERLVAFLERLRAGLRELSAEPLPPRREGSHEILQVWVDRQPFPLVGYHERSVVEPPRYATVDQEKIALLLLGWADGPLRWHRILAPGEPSRPVPPAQQQRALEAMVDMIRDPRAAESHDRLADLLDLPAWRFALESLDEGLARLAPARKPGGEESRIAFVVENPSGDGRLTVRPVLQKRSEGRPFSRGSQLEWHQLPGHPGLTLADQNACRAHDDRFAADGRFWDGRMRGPQVFGVLRALVDHPAVFFEDRRDGRLDIRQGRLRLRFAGGPDGSLSPRFELLGLSLLAPDVAAALHNDRHIIYLHRSERSAPQVFLAQISAEAAALVRALAAAPVPFPPEGHDALATRLEALQEQVDVEFPTEWTRTISAADARLVARLELLVSGAVQIGLCVRPVKAGPVFTPGEGPSLVLEGQGRDRHGARRDLQAERQAAHALVERLGLEGGQETAPWAWRVGEGDPALHLVSTLQDLGEELVVEWADDRLLALGSVGRGDMRMKVADKRDWFAIEGGAEIGGETVPLGHLLAAIRDGRRYVAVGARGFARIEESLKQALERADGAVFDHRGALEISGVASDALMGLVEAETQIEASVGFLHLRRRMREGQVQEPELTPLMRATLRPYQQAGVTWLARLAHWGAGAVLADEMGLGKTVQTLALLSARAAGGPALVVAPTSVTANWVDQAARFTPELRVHLYRGPGRERMLAGLGPGDLVVTSYAIATLDAEALQALEFGALVLDEAQAVKNASTERAKALRNLKAGWRVGLTGTPIENHLGELWSLLRVISPGLLGSWEQFRGRYAVPIEKFGDDSRRKTLAALLRPFVLRRTKAEVAPELPPRTELQRVVRLGDEEMRLYEELRRSTLAELAAAKKDPDRDAGTMRFTLLAALTRLRQLCCHPRLVYPDSTAGSTKAAILVELMGELREADHKVLVFSQFRSFLDLLAPRLRQHGFRVLVLDGTTPAETREQRIAAFQRGEADAFLISLKAGGFGLNLTAADTVVHMDPWWNPAVEDQATARAHRIGQEKPVTALRLVARGTIEEAVLGLHAAKRALAAGILEGTEIAASLGTEELMALIERGGGAE